MMRDDMNAGAIAPNEETPVWQTAAQEFEAAAGLYGLAAGIVAEAAAHTSRGMRALDEAAKSDAEDRWITDWAENARTRLNRMEHDVEWLAGRASRYNGYAHEMRSLSGNIAARHGGASPEPKNLGKKRDMIAELDALEAERELCGLCRGDVPGGKL